MGFAGLYETWCDPTGGGIDTACIITTSANSLAALVHDRMPAILDPRRVRSLARRRGRRSRQGAGAPETRAGRSSRTRRNSAPPSIGVANDDESLQQPIAPPLRAGAGELLI